MATTDNGKSGPLVLTTLNFYKYGFDTVEDAAEWCRANPEEGEHASLETDWLAGMTGFCPWTSLIWLRGRFVHSEEACEAIFQEEEK